MVGQQEAVKAVADAIRRVRAFRSAPAGGSFMFWARPGSARPAVQGIGGVHVRHRGILGAHRHVGIPGAHSVARLIGARRAWATRRYLTEAVRRRPYCVILLDEIEKAHPDVFNVLLQVLDDGRLTDGQGRTVDFRNSVVIMTSNLGSQVIQELAGEANYDKMRTAVMQVVSQHFRPEFINRVDEIVVFHSLGREQIRAIVDIQLGRLRQRLAERYHPPVGR